MADEDHVDLLLKGEKVWNEWRKRTRLKPRLAGADLEDADLTHCDLNGADLQGAKLSGATLSGSFLAWAQLNNAILTSAQASTVYMDHVDLSDANLRDARLVDARLTQAKIQRGSLAHTDLKGSDLSRADLSDVRAQGADLAGVRLVGANLGRAWLEGCHLSEADLSDASLAGAKLDEVDLEAARLAKADLAGATLTRTSLRRADLRDARMSGTVLASCSLAEAKSLSTVFHRDESKIDQATLASSGALPDTFLHGFGIDEPVAVASARPSVETGFEGDPSELRELQARVRSLSTAVPEARRSMEACLRFLESSRVAEAHAELNQAFQDLLQEIFSLVGTQAIRDVGRGIARLEGLHAIGRVRMPGHVRRALGIVSRTEPAKADAAALCLAVRDYLTVLEWVHCSFESGPRRATVYQA